MKMIGSQTTAKSWIELQVETPALPGTAVTPKDSPLPCLNVRVEASTLQPRGSGWSVLRAKRWNAAVDSTQLRRELLDTPIRYSPFLNWSEPIRPPCLTLTVGAHCGGTSAGARASQIEARVP